MVIVGLYSNKLPDIYLVLCDIHVAKGMVHLNIIFSYMKFNKICNLDHPVY